MVTIKDIPLMYQGPDGWHAVEGDDAHRWGVRLAYIFPSPSMKSIVADCDGYVVFNTAAPTKDRIVKRLATPLANMQAALTAEGVL